MNLQCAQISGRKRKAKQHICLYILDERRLHERRRFRGGKAQSISKESISSFHGLALFWVEWEFMALCFFVPVRKSPCCGGGWEGEQWAAFNPSSFRLTQTCSSICHMPPTLSPVHPKPRSWGGGCYRATPRRSLPVTLGRESKF
jgi:hypothetical protein